MRMFWNKKRLYLDYAAATPISKGALKAQKKASELFANPSAIHKDGVDAKASLEDSRKKIASTLGCRAREVVFTSGGTESNNLAIIGFARALENSGTQLSKTHWITSGIEHPSVLECFKELEKLGAEVSYLSVNEEGIIKPDVLKNELKENTVFVSIGWANSEIGVVQPLHALSKTLRDENKKIIFHSDAGQAPLYFTSIVHGLGVDLLTLDSGKLYGPRGIGALYKKNSANISPILFGGSQEQGLRPGSENVSLAAGFAKSVQEIKEKRKIEAGRLSKIRSFFIEEVERNIDGALINGSKKSILPNVVNVSIPNISSEYIALALDHAGISISTKSSCLESEEDKSHVVKALTSENWRAKNTLRFSFGNETSMGDVEVAIRELIGAIERYRRLDPVRS
jgi:cysteine desulfurase